MGKAREEKQAAWKALQARIASDRADGDRRRKSIEDDLEAKQDERDAAFEARFGNDASTTASDAGDEWQAPVPGMADDWNATAASEAAEDAKSPAPKKPLFTFTMDEWKELQKVKKLLKAIDAIDALQRDGKKLYQNQLDKQQRRSE